MELCPACHERPRSGRKSRLCKQCDEDRRGYLYGYCGCGRAIFARGMCATCYSRDLRYRTALRNSFMGSPDFEDDFIHMIENLVNRLASAFGHGHTKWEAYIETGKYASDPDVAEISTLLSIAADLKDEQYRNILRRVNRRLDGVCRLVIPQSRRSVYATPNAPLPNREHATDRHPVGTDLTPA